MNEIATENKLLIWNMQVSTKLRKRCNLPGIPSMFTECVFTYMGVSLTFLCGLLLTVLYNAWSQEGGAGGKGCWDMWWSIWSRWSCDLEMSRWSCDLEISKWSCDREMMWSCICVSCTESWTLFSITGMSESATIHVWPAALYGSTQLQGCSQWVVSRFQPITSEKISTNKIWEVCIQSNPKWAGFSQSDVIRFQPMKSE